VSLPSVGARKEAQLKSWRMVGLCTAALVLVGAFLASTLSSFLSYLLVSVAALLPALLWLRRGGPGIPVLGVFAGMHLVTFALPIVSGREDLSSYSSADLARAAASVVLFLVVACLVAEWFAGRPRRRRESELRSLSGRQMTTFVFLGIGLGLAYQVALADGILWRLGTALGIARAVSLTAFAVAAYFLGVARAGGHLRGPTAFAAFTGLVVVILLNISGLFLIGGVSFAGAAFLGYVLTARRIPWVTLAVFFLLLSILQNGKETMRRKYWNRPSGFAEAASPTQVPGRIFEWFQTGLGGSAGDSISPSVLDRASLLQMLLLAQHLTPDHIDYLRGESYAQLPAMLVPRFLSEDKLASQAGMDLLNRRYGLVSFEGAVESAITWGLIAEGWANFGHLGVLGVGALVGLFCGLLMRWSTGAPAVSRPTLFSIAAMLGLINASDAASVVVNLWQTFVAVLVAFWIFRLFVNRKPRTPIGRIVAPDPGRPSA